MAEFQHRETTDVNNTENKHWEVSEFVSELNFDKSDLSLTIEEADSILENRIAGNAFTDVEAQEVKRLRIEKEINNALSFCNPHFKEGRAYKTNTTQSLVTYELRRRGYDVTALPQRSGIEDILHPFNMWKNPQVLSTQGNGRSDIEQYMKKWGDGARAEVVVTWKGNHGGHIFIAEQVNGKTRFYDPQGNFRDVTGYFNFVSPNSVKLCRIDNLELEKSADLYCEERKKSNQPKPQTQPQTKPQTQPQIKPRQTQPQDNLQRKPSEISNPTKPQELKQPKELPKLIRLEREINDALEGVNPNVRSGRREWLINCQRCAPTYELRRRGYDVTALPLANYDQIAYFPFSVYKNPEIIRTQGNGVAEIEQYMAKWGDGARAEIVVTWRGEREGHAFVAEQVNGETRFYDPQDPKRNARAFFNRVEPNSVRFCRTDNLSFNDEILRKCCV